MRFLLLASLVAGLLVSHASAQQKPYNPYADENADLAPISPDGKINWPTFYKSAAIKAKFDWMFATGSCRGTNPRLNAVISGNKVNVNQLPEEEYSAIVQSAVNGKLVLIDKSMVTTSVMIHPKGVSKVEVVGPLTLQQLRLGMLVRFIAKINEDGTSEQPLASLEVFSNQRDYPFAEIETGERKSQVARIVALRDKTLELRVEAGQLRQLKLPVDDSTVVMMNMDSISLVAPGDKIELKGHRYQGEGITTKQAIFANKLLVTKPPLPEKKFQKRTTSDLSAIPVPAKLK